MKCVSRALSWPPMFPPCSPTGFSGSRVSAADLTDKMTFLMERGLDPLQLNSSTRVLINTNPDRC
jgi:hypothetical protein